jgi:hypothetical protein
MVGTNIILPQNAAGWATTNTVTILLSSIWQIASPKWAFDDATFARSAAFLDNPDHLSNVIHNYRWQLLIEHPHRETST